MKKRYINKKRISNYKIQKLINLRDYENQMLTDIRVSNIHNTDVNRNKMLRY